MVIAIGHMHFKIIENYRDAFDGEQFALKYSEVLNKYDYIVGDIGYEKLRMSGFYRDNKAKVERDKKFSAIGDYISEYCNFGCAYFILQKLTKDEVKALKDEGVQVQTLDLVEHLPDNPEEQEVEVPKEAKEEKPNPPNERRKRPRRPRPGNKPQAKEKRKSTNRTLSSLQND